MKLAGVQALVEWQSLHCAVVAIWVAGLPSAVVPLWQDEQVPLTWLWSTLRGGLQTLVVWQASQALVVVMWVADLPVAWVPLWQLEQLPLIPAWLKLAGVQALVAWQSLHWAVVGM